MTSRVPEPVSERGIESDSQSPALNAYANQLQVLSTARKRPQVLESSHGLLALSSQLSPALLRDLSQPTPAQRQTAGLALAWQAAADLEAARLLLSHATERPPRPTLRALKLRSQVVQGLRLAAIQPAAVVALPAEEGEAHKYLLARCDRVLNGLVEGAARVSNASLLRLVRLDNLVMPPVLDDLRQGILPQIPSGSIDQIIQQAILFMQAAAGKLLALLPPDTLPTVVKWLQDLLALANLSTVVFRVLYRRFYALDAAHAQIAAWLETTQAGDEAVWRAGAVVQELGETFDQQVTAVLTALSILRLIEQLPVAAVLFTSLPVQILRGIVLAAGAAAVVMVGADDADAPAVPWMHFTPGVLLIVRQQLQIPA